MHIKIRFTFQFLNHYAAFICSQGLNVYKIHKNHFFVNGCIHKLVYIYKLNSIRPLLKPIHPFKKLIEIPGLIKF